MREAPSLVLASRLQTEGALVHAWDPLVESHPGLDGVVIEKSLLDAVRDADAAVIVTEWPELESLASEEVREAMRTPLIVDGRNLLDPEAARSAGFDYEGIGRASVERIPPMEAILLAGGKGERLGDAAQGRPKSLVPIAGRPLAAYQVAMLAAAGVDRVIVSCAAGQEELFEAELAGLGPEVVTVGEPEPLGRGGGLRFAAQARQESGPAVRAERGRADRRRPRRAARGSSRARRRRNRRRRPAPHGLRRGRDRRRRSHRGLRRVSEAAPLGQRRRLRPRRRGDRAPPGARRPRADDLPRARLGGKALRLPARRGLADREHAEGPARRGRARAREPRLARSGGEAWR